MKRYGVQSTAYDWFKSYFSNRKMSAVYNDNSSACNYLHGGVPQGSILGSVLLLVHINDIVHCSDKLKFLLYTDDTTVFIQGRNVHELEHTLNCELMNVSVCINSNKLTLSTSKALCMAWHPAVTSTPPVNVTIDNQLCIAPNKLHQFFGDNYW